jgi:hypothetical protein
MDKREAIEALQKEYHYSEILKEDEFIKQEDGTTQRNKIYDIADAFGIKLPVVTFQPDPNEPKGPMPNHTQECLDKKDWNNTTPCACWKISYTGIAAMDVVSRIAQKYNIYSNKFGRGSAYRERLDSLKEKLKDTITIDLSKGMIEIPLDE